MARTRLLPGERELVRLRPSVGAFVPRYLGGVALAAWGLLLGYAPGTPGASWMVLTAAFAGPALVGAALYLPRRRMVRFALALAAGVAAVAVPYAVQTMDYHQTLALTLGACGIVAVALAEADRRLRTYNLTNLRILHSGGLWHREAWTLHYDAVLDLDARQTPLGRLFGFGTLVPILEEPKPTKGALAGKRRKVAVAAVRRPELPSATPRLWGVRPLEGVRRLLEAFVQDATATDYLRAEQQTQKRVGEAMRAVGRANLRR